MTSILNFLMASFFSFFFKSKALGASEHLSRVGEISNFLLHCTNYFLLHKSAFLTTWNKSISYSKHKPSQTLSSSFSKTKPSRAWLTLPLGSPFRICPLPEGLPRAVWEPDPRGRAQHHRGRLPWHPPQQRQIRTRGSALQHRELGLRGDHLWRGGTPEGLVRRFVTQGFWRFRQIKFKAF